MAFTVPTFNLTCNVFTGPWLTKSLRIADLGCNLAIGRRAQQLGNDYFIFSVGGAEFGLTAFLLVPAGSDVRSQSNGLVEDIVEVPAGSGRWYQCPAWEDMAKGFANEYRMVALAKIWQALEPTLLAGCIWPVPTP
jgi:hypothetical protein